MQVTSAGAAQGSIIADVSSSFGFGYVTPLKQREQSTSRKIATTVALDTLASNTSTFNVLLRYLSCKQNHSFSRERYLTASIQKRKELANKCALARIENLNQTDEYLGGSFHLKANQRSGKNYLARGLRHVTRLGWQQKRGNLSSGHQSVPGAEKFAL